MQSSPKKQITYFTVVSGPHRNFTISIRYLIIHYFACLFSDSHHTFFLKIKRKEKEEEKVIYIESSPKLNISIASEYWCWRTNFLSRGLGGEPIFCKTKENLIGKTLTNIVSCFACYNAKKRSRRKLWIALTSKQFEPRRSHFHIMLSDLEKSYDTNQWGWEGSLSHEIFNRPWVSGAVLQTTLSLSINLIGHPVVQNVQDTIHPKLSELGSWNCWENVHPPPCVTCHVSYVRC